MNDQDQVRPPGVAGSKSWTACATRRRTGETGSLVGCNKRSILHRMVAIRRNARWLLRPTLAMPDMVGIARPTSTSRAASGSPMLRHRVVAGGLEQLAVIQPNCAHRAAPQAAGVERDDVSAAQQAERGPVAEDNGGVAAGTFGDVKPRRS